METSKDMMKRLLEQLAHTQDEELDCDVVFRSLDIYAEAVDRGEDLTDLLPLVEQHLKICDCCHEELEALLNILQADSP